MKTNTSTESPQARIRLVATSKRQKRGRVPLKRKRANKPTRTKLIREADRLASLYVRQKDANDDGLVECYTCPNTNHWKKLQNGHWIVRQYKYTRWDEDNMRVQCYACNFLFNGRPHIFRENLVNELGEERVKALETRAKPLFKEKDEWIENQIKVYSTKLEELKNKL